MVINPGFNAYINTAKSAFTQTVYDASKLKAELADFEYTPIKETLQRVAKHFNYSQER